MARFDKYDPVDGGFRARMAVAITGATPNQLGGVFAVSLDANGRVVLGTNGQSGFVGVICPDKTMAVGDVIDVMTHGEIAEFDKGAGGATFAPAAAGTRYRAVTGTTGDLAAGVDPGVAGTNYGYIGHTVEATRLVVRAQRAQV